MTEFECLEHICTEGERWDTLAWRYYGDACAFGRILAANPSLDMDTVLHSGTLVLVPLLDAPELSALKDEELAPWKR